MRLAQPISDGQALTYNVLKVQGCTNSTVGFNLLGEEPTVSTRRYCNKILVHECVSVPVGEPLALDRVEFLATNDPTYSEFFIFKSSDQVDSIDPTIDLQADISDPTKTAGILVNFKVDETCCQPPRLAFKLYGYTDEGEKLLLSKGNLFITPCKCPEGVDTSSWVDVSW